MALAGPDGTLIVAIADGAGSARRAAEGARLAVAQASEALARCRAGQGSRSPSGLAGCVHEAFAAARRAVEELAAREADSVHAFASTLTCLVSDANGVAAGQIGDGLAIARAIDGSLLALTRPQRGEYANETQFLTGDRALEALDLVALALPIDAVAAMTDGLLRVAAAATTGAPHRPFFEPLLAFAERAPDPAAADAALAEFLASDRVNARTDDDKTLVVAVCRQPPSRTAAGDAPPLAGTPAGP